MDPLNFEFVVVTNFERVSASTASVIILPHATLWLGQWKSKHYTDIHQVSSIPQIPLLSARPHR